MVFPGSHPLALAKAATLEPTAVVAAGCAVPDSVTFALELACAELGASATDRHRQLLVVSNWSAAGYRPDILRAVMGQPDARARFASQAAALASARGYGGLLLDFRLLGPRDVDALVSLVDALRDSAKATGLAPVGIVIPVADTSAYPGRHLGALTDFLAVRLELESASPAPPTPRDRISRLVGARAAEIGAHRITLLVPVDGYLWRDGEQRVPVSFEEAVTAARAWGVELVRDESSSTLRARLPGRGEIWVNDAVLLADIMRDARRLGVRRFALYGLGGEDPAIWTAVAGAMNDQTMIRSR